MSLSQDSNSATAAFTVDARDTRGSIAMPHHPVVSVRAGRRNWVDASQLWEFRELLWFLMVRDVKVRYKQAALGVIWVVLQPLTMMAVFSVIFSRLANIPTEGVPAPLYLFAGLLPWVYFASGVANASNSLIGSTSLVSKVYFPRLLLPSAAVGAALVDLAISATLFAGLMMIYRQPLSPQIVLLLPLTLLLVILVLAIGTGMAALNVKYRDVRYVIPFILQLGMFITPVIYPLSFAPEKWRPLFYLNPMTGIVAGIRSAVYGLELPVEAMLASTVLTTLLLFGAVTLFRRMERTFADVI
ncbi:MAG: ABC transporter permease [Planctomycetaceae bacterium]|nr:ABC transporter permease [Planctomycetaceae bacterium]